MRSWPSLAGSYEPAARASTDLARLREAGVSDAEVIDVLAVVALNAFRNSVSIVSETEIDFPKAPRLPSP
ncbi:MAG: hypothetical protein IPJ88_18920 [Myxococcales bacterium]|nr:MAG: hypothetical protein IPJ88_18920 [Myxococcales bacterium]